MLFRATILAVCLALATAAAVQEEKKVAKDEDWVKPAFCNENDCPVFEVLEVGAGYELRRYPAATWVSTMYYANNPAEGDQMQSVAFNKLFQYIDGQNENGDKIAMTAPVLTDSMPATGPNCNSMFVMSFYLPYSLQDNAPQPSAADVYLQELEEMIVYVRSFDGFATQADYLRNTMELAEAVGDMDKLEYTTYFTAGYDSPYKWWERHNESWMKAKVNTRPAPNNQ